MTTTEPPRAAQSSPRAAPELPGVAPETPQNLHPAVAGRLGAGHLHPPKASISPFSLVCSPGSPSMSKRDNMVRVHRLIVVISA